MNIDFHHAVTYVVARIAGFEHDEAGIVAHAAQYVDDATNEGLVRFDNGAMYHRYATAHRMLNYRNFAELANRMVWLPFHFLPGNGGLPPGRAPEGSFIERLITRPNSPVAQEMIRDTILARDKPYAVHRLGIAAHVFVDTWAHQGFAGVNHRVNQVRDVQRNGLPDEQFRSKVSRFFNGWIQQRLPPIGHGAALAYPDRPFLRWSYVNGRGETIERDNPTDFTEAADHLCRVFRRYRLGAPDASVPGLPGDVLERMHWMFRTIDDKDEHVRHARWLAELGDRDPFGIGKVHLAYIPSGTGSWRHHALASVDEAEPNMKVYPYREAFLASHWKMFHDAAKAHRRSIVDDILPRFGICVA